MPGTIPAPVVPTQPTGSGFWAGGSASGMNETSGISCDFSGPHYIATQTLGAMYYRNPSFQLSSATFGLSGSLINPGFKINGTGLLVRVQANVTVIKSYECFATSAWTQNQTFTINSASADTYGNTYGTAAEFSSAYILGTEGNIETHQPYYHRRPWDASIDVTSTSGVVGFNYIMAVRSLDPKTLIFTSSLVDALGEWGEMENGIDGQWIGKAWKFNANSFLLDPVISASYNAYRLNGGYTYSQESLGQLKTLVDYDMGNGLKGGWRWWHRDGSKNVKLPTYDWKRHDWSTIT